MAFLRSVSRRCCASKKLTKCGVSPLPVIGLLENVTAAAAASATTTATRTPPLRLVTQVRGYAASAADAATDVKKQQQQQPASPRQIDPLDLKFNDPIAAFKSKTTKELMRAYFVYQMCTIEYIVENNMKVSLHVCVYIYICVCVYVYSVLPINSPHAFGRSTLISR